MRRVLFVLAALTFVLPQTTGMGHHPYWNDAGSGADAGGSPSTALALPGEGAYSGHLLPTDRDWYRVDRAHPEPVCVDLLARSNVTTGAALHVVDGSLVREGRVVARPGSQVHLALAAPKAQQMRIGMENVEPADYRYQGGYQFTLSRLDARGLLGDAGTTGDAPSMMQGALRVGSGCLGGVLAPQLGVGDARDVFTFTAPSTGAMTLSFAYLVLDDASVPSLGTPPRVDVLTAEGATLASLAQGDVLTVPVTAGEAYYLAVSTGGTQQTAYLVSLTFPGGNPCRPHC